MALVPNITSDAADQPQPADPDAQEPLPNLPLDQALYGTDGADEVFTGAGDDSLDGRGATIIWMVKAGMIRFVVGAAMMRSSAMAAMTS